MRSWCWLACLTGCGFSVSPSPVSGDGSLTDATDAANATDASIDTPDGYIPDARTCFGSGFGALCLPAAPTMPRQLSNTLMFDTGGSSCSALITVGGIETCVLSGTTVTLPAATTFRAIGSRPLVVVASESIVIDGSLSVSSSRGAGAGAGASTASCPPPNTGEDDSGGGGGGAAGSFGGRGGNGGVGDTNATDMGLGGSAATTFVPTTIRGGCPGGRGGNSTGTGGLGSPGGGVVYLIAGTSIRIAGGVFAAGMGGSLGNTRGGGGGGGSGGLIGFDAPAVDIPGAVAANGGGGGEGGGFNPGGNGADGSPTMVRARGGAIEVDGGNGGDGSAGAGLTGLIGGNSNGGGGGGGGGAGYIYVKGALNAAGGSVISPPASMN